MLLVFREGDESGDLQANVTFIVNDPLEHRVVKTVLQRGQVDHLTSPRWWSVALLL